MVTSRHRLSKLEQRINAPYLAGKYIVVRGGATDAEVTDLLKANSIEPDNPANTIVLLRTLCEAEASEKRSTAKPQILYVMDKK
ncbi:hypothetical protein [Nitrobacter vulgaris]|uniref:Uncharacterized protein n=1 Tax=Nitrobacter vulgaris TaxID=29421 RepID=A0A1V4I1Z5_NITVU|nr:hypothetical protein [Nitrobacter vulgaris]OPH84251.1 hypothetical protein B2M20_02975 [Nitrobacter vulgaris]